ncbi:hypothetical protein [Nocardia sp. NPDC050793]|uniref:hypothetical protein n=1 Tax=Nocardia sp. NPDC050793 TaxID=3155159 RepID=UPI0033D7D834
MKRIPEPALVRSILVAVTGVIALFVGQQIDTGWIESAVTVYAAISPIIAGVLIRQAVTPARAATPEPDEAE